MLYDVLFGYSRKDSDTTKAIQECLARAGLRCFCDENLQCPVISVGGPVANRVTDGFQRCLLTDPIGEARLELQHNVPSGDRRMAVWGQTGKDTTDAVDLLISSGSLDKFLRLIWGADAFVPSQ